MLRTSSFDNMWKNVLVAGLFVALAGLASSKQVCYYNTMYKTSSGAVLDSDLHQCTHLVFDDFDINQFWELVPKSAGSPPIRVVLNNFRTRNPRLNILLSFWGLDFDLKALIGILAVDHYRASIIQYIIYLLRDTGFDGFDLNWWYLEQHGLDLQDKLKFAPFCEELKIAFDAEAKLYNYNRLLLTATVSADQATSKTCSEVKEIARFVDFVNVMTLDLHNSWPGIQSYHNHLYQQLSGIGGIDYQDLMNFIRENEFRGAFVWTLDKDVFSDHFCAQTNNPFIRHLYYLLLQDLGIQHTGQCLVDPNFCVGREDGQYVNLWSPNCFYMCVAQLTYNFPCQENLVFVPNPPRCDYSTQSHTTTYNNFCVGRPNGNYISRSQNTFYVCSNGILYELPCPGGLVFNGTHCDYPATATNGPNPPKTCEAGVFYPIPGNATSYYECNHGDLISRSCAPGTVFDDKRRRCLHA